MQDMEHGRMQCARRDAAIQPHREAMGFLLHGTRYHVV
jgi:hypothetical protein